MTTFRSFTIGINVVNGYSIEINRVVSARESDGNSRARIAAKYFGTITTPDGDVIELGINGKTSPQIKRLIGLATATNNSGDKQLNSLKIAKKAMEAAGLDISDIEQKIADREAEIEVINTENQRVSAAVKAAKKAIKEQIKKLEKAAKAMMSAGLDCEDISNQISAMKNSL